MGKHTSTHRLLEYAVLSLVQTATVMAIYSAYVWFWIGVTPDQYLRWLLGGIPMSLAWGWLFVLVPQKVKARFFDTR